jgi:hypothetical protein
MKTDSEADPASYPMGTGSSFPGAETVEECNSPFTSMYSQSLIKAQQPRGLRCVWFWTEPCFQNYQDNFIYVCIITLLNTYINTFSVLQTPVRSPNIRNFPVQFHFPAEYPINLSKGKEIIPSLQALLWSL